MTEKRYCPMGGPETHEVAFLSVRGDSDFFDLGMTDQDLASRCHFYRRNGLCNMVLVEEVPETPVTLSSPEIQTS